MNNMNQIGINNNFGMNQMGMNYIGFNNMGNEFLWDK